MRIRRRAVSTRNWVVRTLRGSAGPLAQVPIVLTTGSSTGREIAASLGVPSLEKPFDVARLLELVQSLVPAAAT
jgi:hypothetical protein